jgi:NTP pyrophosphatase (non-canonical NTP hydrolase)
MPECTRKRPQTSMDDIEAALQKVQSKLLQRLAEKGWGIYVSSHEILGILDEEFDELKDAVRDNDKAAITKECLDIAVGAVFALVSLNTGKMDWPQ